MNSPSEKLARCEITRNPVGTDTWAKGYECPCLPCQIYLGIKRSETASPSLMPEGKEGVEVVGYVSEHTLGELVAAGSDDIYAQKIEQDNVALIRLSDHSAIVEGLEKDLAAQIAGHQETARQSTENLMRANTAQAKIDEAEGRARKHWQAFRDLRLDITGHGPMCRDCADENGRCPHSGRPCDPDEAVREQIAEWKALSRLSDEVAAAIGLTRWMDPPDGGSVSLADQVRRMRTDLAAAEATILSLKKRGEAMQEALRPFASVARLFDHMDDDGGSVLVTVSLSHLRAAAALSSEPGEAK